MITAVSTTHVWTKRNAHSPAITMAGTITGKVQQIYCEQEDCAPEEFEEKVNLQI